MKQSYLPMISDLPLSRYLYEAMSMKANTYALRATVL